MWMTASSGCCAASRACCAAPVGMHRYPCLLPDAVPTILAVGGHLKNDVALSVGREAFISQHIGDLETAEAMDAFERVIADFLDLYEATPAPSPTICTPITPRRAGRWSTRPRDGMPRICRCNTITHTWQPVSPITRLPGRPWASSGTGRATGRTARSGAGSSCWATLQVIRAWRICARFACRAATPPFTNRGGWPSPCCGNCWARRRSRAMTWRRCAPSTEQERAVLAQMLRRDFRSPVTTSAGRLFDGVAALVGLHQTITFEGQAAMALEFAADPYEQDAYPLPLIGADPIVLDWEPLLAALLADLRDEASTAIMAGRFHNCAGGSERRGRQGHRTTASRPQRRLLPESAADRAHCGAAGAGGVHGLAPPAGSAQRRRGEPGPACRRSGGVTQILGPLQGIIEVNDVFRSTRQSSRHSD